jgi:hypothetical protein
MISQIDTGLGLQFVTLRISFPFFKDKERTAGFLGLFNESVNASARTATAMASAMATTISMTVAVTALAASRNVGTLGVGNLEHSNAELMEGKSMPFFQ